MPIPCKIGRRAFTLIELLVVIAILAILVALATPVALGALNRGLAAKCLGNMRQWGIALNLYLSDSYGRLPYEGDQENPTWDQVKNPSNEEAWYNVLPPYVQQQPMSEFDSAQAANLYRRGGYGGLLQCPAAKWVGNEASASGPRFSYAFNSQIFTSSSGRDIRIVSLNNDALAAGGTNVNNRPVGPSTVAMLLDTRASTAEPKALPGMNNDVGTALSYTRRANDRHSKQLHITFFDGSVRAFKVGDIMNASARNIPTSPVIWSPWNPDGE